MGIVRDTPQFCLYLLWFAADSLPAHSCNAWTKDGEGIGDVHGFDGAVFDSVVPHNFHYLGVSRLAGHGLCLAGHNGILDFALGEAFVMLADVLNHGHGVHGLHVDVGESAAYTVLLSKEGDFFAPWGGDDPVATIVVADSESVCLQLGGREEIGDAIAD
jgi:hypothetical protein